MNRTYSQHAFIITDKQFLFSQEFLKTRMTTTINGIFPGDKVVIEGTVNSIQTVDAQNYKIVIDFQGHYVQRTNKIARVGTLVTFFENHEAQLYGCVRNYAYKVVGVCADQERVIIEDPQGTQKEICARRFRLSTADEIAIYSAERTKYEKQEKLKKEKECKEVEEKKKFETVDKDISEMSLLEVMKIMASVQNRLSQIILSTATQSLEKTQ